ncbi:MAG: TIR domain-containing protein [Deltaproteobacteria bacterium]|nr:TIR domain-containing protein [Deltaproteobacteria bacterium]
MSYRNKTYVIFDGDNDMWAYAYMKGWKSNQNVSFNFHDAHDLNVITERASEETVKRKLRERFSSAKQVIVLVGEQTKNLYRFVRWELEITLNLNLPIVAVNLNGKREYDPERCPPILRGRYIVHVPFKANIIQYALDNFPDEYARHDPKEVGDRHYPIEIFKQLEL